jgi:internalin A
LPTISAIPNLTIGQDGASAVTPFSYSPLNAVLAGHSSNSTVIADSGIVCYTASPANLLVIPQPGATGSLVLTVTATLPKGVRASTSFNVTVLPTTPADIPDYILQLQIRETLNLSQAPITAYDLGRLTSLSLAGATVQSLDGLEAAYNLRLLDLTGIAGLDVSAVTALTNLQSLSLRGTGMTNLSVLAGLSQLTNLDLGANGIQFCPDLHFLGQLRTLTLDSNPLGSLGCLASLTNLTDLHAAECGFTSLSFISALPNLKILDVDRNAIQDITQLSVATNLTDIDLDLNQVADATPLAGLQQLHSLELSFNSTNLNHLNSLSALTNLTLLHLARDGITNLSFLQTLAQLSDLDLGYNLLTNITPLGGLPALHHIRLNGNLVTNISALASIPALSNLELVQNRVQSLFPLLFMTNLTLLDIRLNNLDLGAAQPVLDDLEARGVSVLAAQVNSAPSVFDVQNLLVPPNTPISPIPVFFADADSDPCTLTVSAGSSNPAIVANAGLSLSGFCDERMLTVTPVTNQIGLTTITVDVVDLLGATGSVSFNLEILVDAPVTISDPALEAQLRDALGQATGPLTLYDLRSLQSLFASGAGITNLLGLQPAINLQTLDLSANLFFDASILNGLTNLQTLILDGTRLQNFKFVSQLNNLNELSARETGIQNIAALGHKPFLNLLDLSYNLITNVELLTNLTAVSDLTLEACGLHDISFLTNMPALQFLDLANNDIADLRPLLSLSNLISLDVSGNGLDLSPGTTNGTVVAMLESRGVAIPSASQFFQPAILPGSPSRLLAGARTIQFSSIPGRTFTVQASSNLFLWINLGVIGSTASTSSFSDTNAAAVPRRFYRILTGSSPPTMLVGNVSPATGFSANIIPVFGTGTNRFALDASSDLKHWTALCTNSALNGGIAIDTSATNSPRRFYRLRIP